MQRVYFRQHVLELLPLQALATVGDETKLRDKLVESLIRGGHWLIAFWRFDVRADTLVFAATGARH